MGKIIGGTLLLVLAAFMLLGFINADLSLAAPATWIAVVIAVVLPAVGGVALLKPGFVPRRVLQSRRAEIRQRTLESEVLRLAGQKAGKLTIVEVVSELAILPDEAKAVLDNLALQGLADFEVTDSGIVVYDFHDVRHIADKADARGILDD